MDIYLSAVFGIYFVFLIVLAFGWRRAVRMETSATSKNIFISVVIAVRNEANNIDDLIHGLITQEYPSSNFEIILVDDHSEDETLGKAKQWIDRFRNLKIISAPDEIYGKKLTLNHGINSASGEVIATTDADCVLSSDWLADVNKTFSNEECNMLIGAVAIKGDSTLFNQLQSIEFASVIGIGISLAALRKPIMCNGANLSFRREIFLSVKGYEGNEKITSGDDEFLMRKISKKFPGTIQGSNPIHNTVFTKPQPSLKDFTQQRLRWAGKWKANSSLFSKSLAVFVLLIQISWLLLIALIFLSPSVLLFVILFSKVIGELFFLAYFSKSLKTKFGLFPFLLLQFIYPIYVLSVGFFSQVMDSRWKGRPVYN